MFEDDDELDDDFSEEDDGESDLDKHREMPVFKKAMHIGELTRAITDTFDEEKDVFKLRSQMLEMAYILGAKIAGAEAADVYSIRMENAMLIKINARELHACATLALDEELSEAAYLEALKKEIDDFRGLFIEWVKSFDKTNDIEDDWDILNL
jgi:hypothetical protein